MWLLHYTGCVIFKLQCFEIKNKKKRIEKLVNIIIKSILSNFSIDNKSLIKTKQNGVYNYITQENVEKNAFYKIGLNIITVYFRKSPFIFQNY